MQSGKVSLSITIQPADQGPSPLVIDASGVPGSGKVGEPFSGSIKVSGGTAPYSFSLDSGAFPDGVSLAADGTISGTPTADGTFSPVVLVSDSSV